MKLNRFFVTDIIYKERLAICKSCEYYFKPTGTCKRCGCFMKIKASIGSQTCKELKWLPTVEISIPKEVPEHLIDEVFNIWEGVKTGVAKDIQTKRNMIELYNTIYGSKYSVNTSCSSCLNTCYKGIKKIYKKYHL